MFPEHVSPPSHPLSIPPSPSGLGWHGRWCGARAGVEWGGTPPPLPPPFSARGQRLRTNSRMAAVLDAARSLPFIPGSPPLRRLLPLLRPRPPGLPARRSFCLSLSPFPPPARHTRGPSAPPAGARARRRPLASSRRPCPGPMAPAGRGGEKRARINGPHTPVEKGTEYRALQICLNWVLAASAHLGSCATAPTFPVFKFFFNFFPTCP